MRTERFSHLYFILLIFLLLLNSCEEKPDIIGLEIFPGKNAHRVSFDSLSVIRGYTVYGDSVRGNFKVNQILGSQVDPYFGFSKAEIITQLQPSTGTGSFGSNPKIDSVILYLKFNEITGELGAPMSIHVYEYNEYIDRDSSYYSNMDITGKYRGEEIGTASLSTSDTLTRIRISDSIFINKFLTAEDTILQNQESLQEWIKGLYITTDDAASEGVFVTMDWVNLDNRLIFYYSNDSINGASQTYAIGQASIGINLFQHDYSGYPIEPFINNGSESDSIMFMQSMGGVSPMIWFEGMTEWSDSMPLAIIDAKLILPAVDSNLLPQKSFYNPAALDLYLADNNYRRNFDDLLVEKGSNGSFDSETNSYIFNLKAHIQGIINGDVENFALVLKVRNGNEKVNRIALHGWSWDPARRMRLEIIYSKL